MSVPLTFLMPSLPAIRVEGAAMQSLVASGGWCGRCGTIHSLPSGSAQQACLQLMDELHRHQRLDFSLPEESADPRCSTRSLFGEAGGKMFGILTCRDRQGCPVVLRAFSGLYSGLWQVEGWEGPLFNVTAFNDLIRAPEQEIKRIGREMATVSPGSSHHRHLRLQRRTLSQNLMRDIHGLYQVVNARGEKMPLTAAFIGSGAPPAGTGDCCGPKLLYHAFSRGLKPEALAEFYWGQSNASSTRQHGQFYPACAGKCQPILGFMLCGLRQQ